MPSADSTPLAAGTTTRRIPSASATSQACSGPAPPKATSSSSRGSCPRSTLTDADRAHHLLVGHGDDSLRRRRARSRTRSGPGRDRSPRGLRVEPHGRPPAAPPSSSRPSTRFASVTVGTLAAAAVAGRPGIGPGAVRADAQRAAAVDPGDAARRRRPTVWMSSIGSRTGRPATSRSDAARRPSLSDQRDVAAGAAHVEGDGVAASLRRPPRRHRRPAPKAAAAPGAPAASAGVQRPPLDCISNGSRKPRAAEGAAERVAGSGEATGPR